MTAKKTVAELGLILDLEKTVKVNLESPVDGQPLVDLKGNPFWVDVKSSKSESFERDTFKMKQAISDKYKGKSKGYKPTFEETRQIMMEGISLIITDWYVWEKNGDKVFETEFNRQNVVKFLLAYPWIVDQIAATSDKISEFVADTEGNLRQES